MDGNRTLRVALALATAAGCLPWGGCDRKPSVQSSAAVAVSNSYLASAVREVAGGELRVISLAPPGTCPGHFDIRPSQVEALRHCRVLLRFDFQQAIDTQLADLSQGGPQIQAVEAPGAMCEPSSYLEVCRQATEAMVAAHLTDATAAAQGLGRVEQQMKMLSEQCRQCASQAGLRGATVLCSGHQKGFCQWLGLDVVGTFSGSDSASLGQLDSAIEAGRKAGVRLVIGNQPEGRGAADTLAEQLGARVVMFDNFPAAPQDKGTYDAMVRENVNRLVRAGRP